MKILVFDPAHCLSLALVAETEGRLDIELTLRDIEAFNEAEVSEFDAVLLPPLAHLDSIPVSEIERHAERVESLIAPCRDTDTILVWCVSDEIYEYGYDGGAIEESLIPRPESPSRKRLVATGDRIRQELQHYLMVRMGPLFGLRGKDAWLPHILEGLFGGHIIKAEEDLYIGPTPVDALARGLCGMLLQLNNGANAWGPYHLSGIEPVSVFTFINSVRTQLVQQVAARGLDAEVGSVEPIPHRLGLVRRVLNCRHMLGTFGVHQKPWRLEIERLIEHWLDERLAVDEPEHK